MLPNCLIIGAMRSGTTALYTLLGQHPDIYMSPYKEPNFFAVDEITRGKILEGSVSIEDRSEYEGLFEGATSQARVGEASHSYLYYSDRVAPRLAEALPGVKLICILRDPAKRAFSHYLFHVQSDREDIPSFREALAAEDDRIRRGLHFGHYTNRGFYAQQLRPYHETFEAADIKVLFYEDLQTDPVALAQDAYRFLGVDDSFAPDASVRRNPSGLPRSGLLHAVLVKANPLKRAVQHRLPPRLYRLATRLRDRNLARPEEDMEVRSELIARFRPDIEELQERTRRDLGEWLS